MAARGAVRKALIPDHDRAVGGGGARVAQHAAGEDAEQRQRDEQPIAAQPMRSLSQTRCWKVISSGIGEGLVRSSIAMIFPRSQSPAARIVPTASETAAGF